VPYIDDVSPIAPARPEPVPLDRRRGRLDARPVLRLRLPEAPSEYLEGALDNPELGTEELALLLRNRATTVEIVTRIGGNRAWMRPREIKVALVGNPRAPQVLARRFLPHLFWHDLADLASNLRVSPVVRREAEKLIRTRLPELSVGERVTLARRGSRGIIEMFRDETEAPVLQALAGNPRATEADVSLLLARAELPTPFLSWLADRSSWSARRIVRLALVRHPKTPPPSALRLLPSLSPRDIDDLRHDPMAPRLVRVAAERHPSVIGSAAAGVARRIG